MRGDDWKDRTRNQKLACVLYPNQTTEGTRQRMRELAGNELKRPPSASPILPDHKRGALSPLGGEAKRSQQRR